jgi:methylglutaconyl-CoA hydratase
MHAMVYTRLKYSIDQRICTITMHRPDKRNTLDDAMVQELTNAFVSASKDNAVKVIVLTGSGTIFCAGEDLEYVEKGMAYDFGRSVEEAKLMMRLAQIIYSVRKPVIAKVNGAAHAGGCLLIAICDYVIATEKASFGFTEVRNGMLPALAVPFLVKKIGEGKARELMLRGIVITAAQAKDAGLVTSVSTPESLDSDTQELAEELCASVSGSSMGLLKEMFATMEGMKFNESIEYAANMHAAVRMTEECKKGIAGLLKKEKIVW